MTDNAKTLQPAQREELLNTLQTRFEKHPGRHQGLEWSKIQAKLEKSPEKLWSLHEMERTGGEPDVIAYDAAEDAYTFCDCSPETPARRSICYDRAALEARKKHKPETSALDVAAEMGIQILDEQEYRALQKLGPFDQKTSSWILTPAPIRKLGGALFGDYRYGQVFIYHNGADSYYASRSFRGTLRV